MHALRSVIARCLLPATLWMSGCGEPNAPSTPLTLVRLRPEATAFLNISGYDSAATLVVRDRDAWQQAWSEIHRRVSPIPPLPTIDFSTEMIVVAALGSRPTSGYDILFAGASEAGAVVTLEVVAKSPGPGCVTLTVVTSPVDLARV